MLGILLILAGVVVTPLDQPVGNASFWLGVILAIIGTVATVLF